MNSYLNLKGVRRLFDGNMLTLQYCSIRVQTHRKPEKFHCRTMTGINPSAAYGVRSKGPTARDPFSELRGEKRAQTSIH